MKSILIHLVFFSLIGLCCFQSFSQTFSQVYEERLAFNMPTSILEGDSFYIVAAAGYTAFSGTLSYRFGIKLFKTDKQGNLIWKKIYSESGKGISIGSYGSLAEVADGYLICGDEYDTTTTDVTFVLMKFDNEGDFQWIKSYPRGGKQECFHGSLTSDKSYIMIGETFFNNQSSDYYVLKTDSLGNKEWDRTYGINGTQDRGFNVYQVYDGGYVLGGISNSFGDPADSWIVKIDSAGDEEWSDTYGTSGEDVLVNLSASASGYLVWGGADTVVYNTQTQYNEMIIKSDFNGVVQWRTFFNHKKNRITRQVRELLDGSIVAIGEQQVGAADSTAGWIAKLNSSGDVLWERFYINENHLTDSLYSRNSKFSGDFQYTSDHHFIIAGNLYKSTETFNGRTPQIWLVKLDSNGCMGPDSCGYKLSVGINEIQPTTPSATIIAYPNPFTTQALISIKTNSAEYANEKIEFQLFDVSGRLV